MSRPSRILWAASSERCGPSGGCARSKRCAPSIPAFRARTAGVLVEVHESGGAARWRATGTTFATVDHDLQPLLEALNRLEAAIERETK